MSLAAKTYRFAHGHGRRKASRACRRAHLPIAGSASGMGSLPAVALGRRLVSPMCLARVHGGRPCHSAGQRSARRTLPAISRCASYWRQRGFCSPGDLNDDHAPAELWEDSNAGRFRCLGESLVGRGECSAAAHREFQIRGIIDREAVLPGKCDRGAAGPLGSLVVLDDR